jgi:acyl-CoA synthetase (AMP-forming)/AMP-acid ligase II
VSDHAVSTAELSRAAHVLAGRPWTSRLVRDESITARIRTVARRQPGRCAVTQVRGDGGVARSVSYGELVDEVGDRARRLAGSGVGPGLVAAVSVGNDVPSLVTLLGVLDAGAAALVVDAQEPSDRRDEIVGAFADVVVEPERVVALGRSGARRDDGVPEIGDGRAVFGPALVLCTTGTTAVSKAVVQSHYSVLVNATSVARHHRMGRDSLLVCPLTISHVNGLELGVLAALFAGGHSVLLERFDPLRFVRILGDVGADVVTTVPSILRTIADFPRWTDLPRLRYFISAAAPLPAELANDVMGRCGKRIVQGYGLTECMNFATTMPLSIRGSRYEEVVLRSRIPPVGSALPGCEVSVQDPQGRPLVPGVTGEVCVRGHSVMNGYLGNDPATREAFRGGWFRTGDLGMLATVEGAPRPVLTIVGRVKHVAKCGGLAVSLEELERSLLRSDAVKDACCVARPDRLLGEAITAFVVAPDDSPDDELLGPIAKVVDPRRVAARIERIEAIPLLRSGKPDRRRLRDLVTARTAP